MDRPNFDWWTRPHTAAVFDLRSRTDYGHIFTTYQGTRPELIGQVLDQAIAAGARSVVAEYRYLDADYRNEHSRFYSTTFRRYPSIAHRLHYFSEDVPPEALEVLHPSHFQDYGDYLGYSVMRPVPAGPVGRTVLKPPSDLIDHVSCKAPDAVNLFGTPLEVIGSPFMTQESQLGVCIHVTAWVCAYTHHLRSGAQRLYPGEIAALAPHGIGRLVPAPPMSVGQLSAIFENADLPAVVYDLSDLPDGETKFTIACRYLNSGFPVVVAGGGHAFVLVGYRRTPAGGSVRIEFIRQDDRWGPYDIVEDPIYDRWRPWEYLVIPLPPKVYVSGEKAERVAGDAIYNALMQRREAGDEELLRKLGSGEVVLRTTAMPSNEFKSGLASRSVSEVLIGPYQWTHMSRWVWVVEAVDHEAWDAGRPSVVAEVLIDATDHTGDTRPLSRRIPREMVIWEPDRDEVSPISLPDIPLFDSVCGVDASVKGGGNGDA